MFRARSFACFICTIFVLIFQVSRNSAGRRDRKYTIADIGTVDGYLSSYAAAINDRGEVVGYCDNTDLGEGSHAGAAFVYRQGRLEPIQGFPAGQAAAAIGIANDGAVACVADKHTFLYRGNKLVEIGHSSSGSFTACHMSSRGTCVGAVIHNDSGGLGPAYAAARYSDGRLEVLVSGKDADRSFAALSNDNGVVIGFDHNEPNRFEAGQAKALRMFPKGATVGLLGLNSRGDISGVYTLAPGVDFHAFACRSGRVEKLWDVPGGHSMGLAISDSGIVYGSYSVAGTEGSPRVLRACLFLDGKVVDLNERLSDPASGWILSCAKAVNRSGQIAGFGWHLDHIHAFLLTPLER